MNRRAFLAALAAAGAPAAPRPRIDAAALQAALEALSVFGRPEGGAFKDGVSRVGYSDADIAGRNFCMDLMTRAGAQVRIDAAGNIFATRPGSVRALAPVLFGSHIDSVPNGGNFDGTLGSISSLLILRTLNDLNIQTRRPLTAVIWACEESSFAGASLNGSRIAADKMPAAELNLTSRGLTKSEAIRRIGGEPTRLETAHLQQGQYHAYVEMHIEQGATLARDKVPVGVVDGIVSIDDYDVVIQGVANHAGTTPMRDRQDAMIAASHLTLAVREIVTAEPGAQVGTVGHLEVIPNAVNVVPGEVRMSIEFRDLSSAKLDRLGEAIRARAAAIAAQTRTSITLTKSIHQESAKAAPEIQRVIEAAASRLRLDTRHLPSGAGHDAQMMATLMPMGMIFVPSIGGISHSPKELTTWEDCANGANMLLETVLDLAA
ncbi:MAG: Zn-dependent hydrolase [Bryobacteraceae bacterium]|nr:Zn-dependent hydrolase [Bryobacteraceae bacterium]